MPKRRPSSIEGQGVKPPRNAEEKEEEGAFSAWRDWELRQTRGHSLFWLLGQWPSEEQDVGLCGAREGGQARPPGRHPLPRGAHLARGSCSGPSPGSAAPPGSATPTPTAGGSWAPAWRCPWAASRACAPAPLSQHRGTPHNPSFPRTEIPYWGAVNGTSTVTRYGNLTGTPLLPSVTGIIPLLSP